MRGDIRIGQRLRMRRLILGLSQRRLGDAIGVTMQQIHKYESAATRISASRLHQLSDLLGVPISFFFDETGHEALDPHRWLAELGEVSEARQSGELTYSDTIELIRAFWRISDPTTRRNMLDLIRSLARRFGENDL